MTDKTQEAAFLFLEKLEEKEEAYEIVNDAIRKLQPDFPATLQVMDFELYGPMRELIDEVLGCDIASYYLCEAKHMKGAGLITEKDGTEWPIRNLEDVRAYVKGSKP
jgi:hypothetical protein